jgi:light-regulated signal transduction histidine kinase (bacteriophytochrome)
LKEPLRKIQAFGNILKEKASSKLEEAEYKYIDKMITSSNRMQNLVDDILTLSRLSNTEVAFTPTDLNDIISKIVEDLEITINDKHAKVEVDKLPTIKAVPGQMHQLFQNLITNGLKFNESKAPTIRVILSNVSKKQESDFDISAENFYCIEVIDDGIGFEQKYADKIFGIFQRLDGNSYQGSGIGLAICKKIMDNHKGHIIAESAPGKGAKFILLFPK